MLESMHSQKNTVLCTVSMIHYDGNQSGGQYEYPGVIPDLHAVFCKGTPSPVHKH